MRSQPPELSPEHRIFPKEWRLWLWASALAVALTLLAPKFVGAHARIAVVLGLILFAFLVGFPLRKLPWIVKARSIRIRTIRAVLASSICLALTAVLGVFSWPVPDELDAKLSRILAAVEKNAKDSPHISLPGFSFQALITIHNSKTSGRSYIYDRGIVGGSHFAIYVSQDKLFTFLLTDTKGESFELRVPIGPDGVPLNEVIYLACEVGLTATTTRMEVLVNGKTVAFKETPIVVDLGPVLRSEALLGGSLDRREFGNFILYELLLYSRTLTVDEMKQILEITGKDHPGVRYPVIH